MNKTDIVELIKNDAWMIEILKNVQQLNLPDWWIGAGFVRSKVWDHLHYYKQRTPLPDIDVIYFDQKESADKETLHENTLKKSMPEITWSVTNQAHIHTFHNDKPYKNSEEALSHWVETATCIGVRLTENDQLTLATPRGIDDLVNLIIRPTHPEKDLTMFYKRIEEKQWLKKWPKLKVITT